MTHKKHASGKRVYGRLIYVVPLVVFAGLAWYFGTYLTSPPAEEASPLLEQDVPQIEIATFPGKKCGVSLQSLKGEVTVLTFFASWCGPCAYNHEILKGFVKDHPVRLFGINYHDDPLNAQMWLLQKGDPYTCIGSDPQGQAGVAWGVKGVPQMYIVDRKGKIRYSHMGVLRPETIQERIVPLLKKLTQEPQ
jgi:cytochrome c biogenesis protein CcmG/thiol:disulfide interchange protein DsbE